jgi:hypothetical protein
VGSHVGSSRFESGIAIIPASVWIGGVIFAAAVELRLAGGIFETSELTHNPRQEQTMYAIFACQKKKNRAVDPPCLDPLSYGRYGEPEPLLLLRRGRVQLFASEAEAQNRLCVTIENALAADAKWPHEFDFVILECNQ